jgi:N-acetylglucosamine malate deacetylase 1
MENDNAIKRILAVGAHPDDLEILAGGTLAKYAQNGAMVSMAVATDGAAGHLVIPPKELAEIRHREAENSAKVIGADFYWLGFGDEMLDTDVKTRMAFVELIRKARPDVIITHNPGDYHPDHRAVSKLMFEASFASGLKSIQTETPFHPGVQPLVYMDNVNGANFIPTEYVDVSATYAIKHRMLACFESQIQWLRDHDNVDFFNMTEISARSRGYQSSVEFAEGFGLENVWPRTRTYRLLP